MAARCKPESCRSCPCYAHGTDFSQVEGSGAIPLLIVGEASGASEARDQLPFRPFAQAGSVLTRIIRMAGFDRAQFSLTNCVRCKPRGDWLEKAPWELDAIGHCSPNLDQVVKERRPRCIWTLGGIALRTLTGHMGKHRSISSLQGYVLDSFYPLGDGFIPVVPSLHPSFIARGASEYYFAVSEQLKRAVAVAIKGFQRKPINYITHPSADQAQSFYNYLRDNSGLLLAYDIETPNSKEIPEDEREGDPSYDIDSIQFSFQPQTGIFFPAQEPYLTIAKAILALPNRKAGWNNFNYDNPRLRHNGFVINGMVEDFMWKWHHFQPDLPMNLQFAGQWLGMDFPWKHLSQSEPQHYGCADVDAVQRADAPLAESLRNFGITESYERYVLKFYPILERCAARGLPIDDNERVLLGVKLDKSKEELDAKMQAHVPVECRNVSPKNGYKKTPKDTTDLIQRAFPEAAVSAAGEPITTDVMRWCRLEPFKPSSKQLITYMKLKGHKVPRKIKETNPDGSAKDTTEQKELERLFVNTGDMLYKWVVDFRGVEKMKSTYVDGFAPAADGRVHTTFTLAPAQWQTSSRGPNLQNTPVHKDLADDFNRIVVAPPGHKLVKFDWKSFHPLMLSFEAEDPVYMRVVRMDVHSYLTAFFKKVPKREEALTWDDDTLRDWLSWIKKTYKHERDYKCKRVTCGWGNGERYRLCYQQWREYFTNESECKRLFELIDHLFAKTAKWKEEICYKASVWPMHGGRAYLISRYGALRWFWETYKWDHKACKPVPGNDYNKVQAFFPPNNAFGQVRDSIIACAERGYDEKYGFVNTVHDSLDWVCPDALVEGCVHNVREIMQAPNPKLVNSIAPDGLWVECGVKVGQNLAERYDDKGNLVNPEGMEELKLPRPPYNLVGPLFNTTNMEVANAAS